MRTAPLVVAAALLLPACTALVPQEAAPLITDEAAGEQSIYLTEDRDIQETLERIAVRVQEIVAEEGPEAADSDRMNMEFLDIVFVSGHRGAIEFGMPGNGTASITVHEGDVHLAMTGNVMACWGLRVGDAGVFERTSVFNPGCDANSLSEAEWSADWPGRPEPISSSEGFEFGIPPSAR